MPTEGSPGHDAVLREVVFTLAVLERKAGSPGEHEAARWLAERLRAAGAQAEADLVEFHDGYALLLLPLGVAGVLAGLAALRRRGRLGPAVVALLGTAAMVDDVSNRYRVWRRLVARRKQTSNVVATVGEEQAPQTLVVLAHHDAAPTGVAFDQSLQRWLARRYPRVVARVDTSLPLWWPVVAGPLLVAAGSLTGHRGLLRAGIGLGSVAVALGADVARSPIVPGANDNLSAVAALVALAEHWRDQPPSGVRVLLVSCGAEEVLQGGIYAFARRFFPDLDPGSTYVLNLDTIGSPELVMLEGEGPFWMEDYTGPHFRDLVARAAERVGGPLRRGLRSRASTDSVIPSRHGYPTATLVSWEPETKLLSNYHLMSDTPENLCFDTVAHAVAVVAAVGEELARHPHLTHRPEPPGAKL